MLAIGESFRTVPADQPTIQQSVDVAQPGDVIDVAGGNYDEAVVIDGKSHLRISGKGNPSVDGSVVNTPFMIQSSTNITLEKLVIQNGVSRGSDHRIQRRHCSELYDPRSLPRRRPFR